MSFADLPSEIVSHVLSFIPPVQLYSSCNRVCKEWYVLTNADGFWKIVCERAMLRLSRKPSAKSWKWYYLSKRRRYSRKTTKTGIGRIVYGKRSVYEGEIVAGKKCGWGRIRVKREKYEGELLNDKKHGKGRYSWGDGEEYNGEWKDGKCHGKGVYKWKNGNIYEGGWQFNKRCGEGIHVWKRGDVYQGGFKNNRRHGYGKYTWPDGRSCEGTWKRGNKCGKCTYKWPDGSMYIGEWKNDKRCGQGTMSWTGGTWTGEWHNDHPTEDDGDTEGMPWRDFFNYSVDGMRDIIYRYHIRQQVKSITERAS